MIKNLLKTLEVHVLQLTTETMNIIKQKLRIFWKNALFKLCTSPLNRRIDTQMGLHFGEILKVI